MNPVEIGLAIGVEGFLHCEEASRLTELAVNKDVLEIGAWKGLSAFCMAISAKSVQSIDKFTAATDGQRDTGSLTSLDDYRRAVMRFNNVHPPIVASSSGAVESVAGPFDFIFIDATHTYEEVKQDIQRWWPKLRPGGVLAGHDYGHDAFPGVKQAFDEIFGPAPEGTTVVTLRWVNKPA